MHMDMYVSGWRELGKSRASEAGGGVLYDQVLQERQQNTWPLPSLPGTTAGDKGRNHCRTELGGGQRGLEWKVAPETAAQD